MTAPEGQATERFQFGENWTRFLSLVDEERIAQASARLAEMVGDISGKSFLDAGSGSGIHSLAAVRLGAARVVSFDYDPKSVACTAEMKRRFAPMANWQVERDQPWTSSICARSDSLTLFIPGACSTIPAQCGRAWISSPFQRMSSL